MTKSSQDLEPGKRVSPFFECNLDLEGFKRIEKIVGG